VDATVRVRAVTFFAKLFSPLARFMMGTMRRCVEDDFNDIEKALTEGPRTAVRGPSSATAP
jgi:hypothetical protein